MTASSSAADAVIATSAVPRGAGAAPVNAAGTVPGRAGRAADIAVPAGSVVGGGAVRRPGREPSSSAALAPVARANRGRIHSARSAGVASCGDDLMNASSAAWSCAAVARASRLCARAQPTALASAGGVRGAACSIGCQRPSRITFIASTTSPRSTIVRAASSSHSTTPSENTSLRPSSGRPTVCSGDMYAYLPFTTPGRVSSALIAALAMPKSTSLVTPSNDTIRLCGDTSRWTSASGEPSASSRRWA